jgi:D-arabinose 1-dehydrogenase-like Zn-dependent alcohol dehydrogenase
MTPIPSEALAATWYKHGDDAKFEQKPVKKGEDLAPGEVRETLDASSDPHADLNTQCLIRIHYSGVCHSDLSNTRNEFGNGGALPQVFGHEGTGVIVAIGARTQTRLKVGDKVGVKYVQNACLECEMCRRGYESSCEEGPV